MVIPQWTKYRTITCPSSATPGYKPKESKSVSISDSVTLYHGTVHHSQKAATWYPPTDEWTKKIHTTKCRSVK